MDKKFPKVGYSVAVKMKNSYQRIQNFHNYQMSMIISEK